MSAISERTIPYEIAIEKYGVILATKNPSISLTIRGPQGKMTEDNIRKVLLAVGNYNIALEKAVAAADKRLNEKGINLSYDAELDELASRTDRKAVEALNLLHTIYSQTGLSCS